MKKQKIIIAVLLFAFLILSNIWCSYNLLKVNTYTYTTDKVNQPIKAVVIADLHDHSFGKDNERLLHKIKELNPDIVLMTGDFVNGNSQNANKTYTIVKELVKDYPVYYSLGNHEIDYMNYHHDTEQELLKNVSDLGATVLEKEFVDITVKNNQLRIGGMYDYAFGLDDFNTAESAPKEIKNFLYEFEDTDALKIMLAHRPDSFIFGDASSYWDIDLVISGHNHGGQFVVPFLGGLYGGDQGYFPKYIHGLYPKDKMHIFITSGLGSHIQKLPRFNNIPEIALIQIEPSVKGQ